MDQRKILSDGTEREKAVYWVLFAPGFFFCPSTHANAFAFATFCDLFRHS